MDSGALQSGRTTAPPDPTMPQIVDPVASHSQPQTQHEVAMEDSEILRRLVRLLSKSEEDELFAQDANRHPSSSAFHSHTLHRSKSEGDSSAAYLNRSHSIMRLADTAPLRISRPPKVDLTETYKEFERNSTRLRANLSHLQFNLRQCNLCDSAFSSSGMALAKAATKMSLHLEHVTNYMKQQIELLARAEIGPPSDVHATNLSSALSTLAQSTRALGHTIEETRDSFEGLLCDMEESDVLENLAQLAESEARSLKDGREDDTLKRMSGIQFRQHSAELNSQFARACEEASVYVLNVVKSIVPAARGSRDREMHRHLILTGLAALFSVVIAIMLSTSVDQGSSSLNQATSGIWLVSLSCGVASGITSIVGVITSEHSSSRLRLERKARNASYWLAVGSEALFFLAATLFSIGLCVFAFSSAQATAVRAIVVLFTSLHSVALFVLIFWKFRPCPSWNTREQRNSQNSLTSSHHRPAMIPPNSTSFWSTFRRLAQLSIHSGGGGGGGAAAAAVDRSSGSHGIRRRNALRASRGAAIDMEQGLPRDSNREERSRRSAPPIIRITDTDREERGGVGTNGSPTEGHLDVPASRRTSILRVSNPDARIENDSTSSPDTESDGGQKRDSVLTSIDFPLPPRRTPGQDQTGMHRVDLEIPSAQRLSSDSSRSLPALPPDVQVVRSMAYSLNGVFLCIGNTSPQERCTIFSTDSPAITLGELKLTDIARQIEWSMDGENILLRLTHMIYVWNAMPSNGTRRPVIIIHHESDDVKWLSNNTFLSARKDILTSFDTDGTPTGIHQIPSSSIQDFVAAKDERRVICLASSFATARYWTETSSPQKLIVYNLDSKAVEQIAPVGRDAMTLARSVVSPDLVLVNFAGTTPPQIWRFRENTDAAERRTSATFLSFKRAMGFKAPAGRFSGYGIFGSVKDKLILSLGEDGDMFIFVADTGQPLRHITTGAQGIRPLTRCVAWDSDILTFTVCMACTDGSIRQWKTPLDAIGHEVSSSSLSSHGTTSATAFAVITLGEEDATLIRLPDVAPAEHVL